MVKSSAASEKGSGFAPQTSHISAHSGASDKWLGARAMSSGHLWWPCPQDTSGGPVLRTPLVALSSGHLWWPCPQDTSGGPVLRTPLVAMSSGHLWWPCPQDTSGGHVLRVALVSGTCSQHPLVVRWSNCPPSAREVRSLLPGRVKAVPHWITSDVVENTFPKGLPGGWFLNPTLSWWSSG